MDSQPSYGLVKRQTSLSVEEGKAGPNINNNNNLSAINTNNDNIDEAEAGGGENSSGGGSGISLLSTPDGDAASQSSSQSNVDQNLHCFVYGHIALSAIFLGVGSSIVPLFMAAKDDNWRTQNTPYQKTAAGDIILDFQLNKPLVDPPTVSSGMLIITGLVLPLIFILFINMFDVLACKRIKLVRVQRLHELRASVCAFLVSIGLSETVTCTLKLYVSRHRPNFYALCGFDPAKLKCTAALSKVHEASLSFPSGHSSFSFCAMTFLMYFLLGRLARITSSTCVTLPITGQGVLYLRPYKSLLRVLCCLVPWSYSVFVATSRIVDNWHHPSDIIAGTLLGIAAATVGYHAFYPPTSSSKAGIPLSLQQQQQQSSTITE